MEMRKVLEEEEEEEDGREGSDNDQREVPGDVEEKEGELEGRELSLSQEEDLNEETRSQQIQQELGEFLPEEYLFDYVGLQNNRKLAMGGNQNFLARAANGFVKLFTEEAVRYWCAQTSCENRAPDWKLHFSVQKEDVPLAWNLLSRLFVDSGKGALGMKAMFGDEWDLSMRGREITVYLFQFPRNDTAEPCYSNDEASKKSFKKEQKLFIQQQRRHQRNTRSTSSARRVTTTTTTTTEQPRETFKEKCFRTYSFSLGTEKELQVRKWCKNFLWRAENLLKCANIRGNGTADGDKALPGCEYATLRNETFIYCRSKNTFIYPPNNSGWNASCMPDVFSSSLERFSSKRFSSDKAPTLPGDAKAKKRKSSSSSSTFVSFVSCGHNSNSGSSSSSSSSTWNENELNFSA